MDLFLSKESNESHKVNIIDGDIDFITLRALISIKAGHRYTDENS